MNDSPPVVVIVGGGFGGLRVARALRGSRVAITLLDRRNYHLFQPLLYQVATAGLSPGDIAHPLRGILRGQQNLKFRLSEVRQVDFIHRTLETETGLLNYDYLVLAVGSETNFFNLSSIAAKGLELKDLDDAIRIRNHLLRQFEMATQQTDPMTRRAMLTFVIVGGGPTGVETAGAISELIRLVLLKDYAELSIADVRVILMEATERLLPFLPEPLQEAAAEKLGQKHVEVHFGASVTHFDGFQVTLKSGEIIPANTLIWSAGVRAAELTNQLGVAQGPQGRVIVRPTLQLPDHPQVFVIGDAACWAMDEPPLPMTAPVAVQMAEAAAANIMRLLNSGETIPFVYKKPGAMATIGRNAAVAHLGPFQFKGVFAWLVWLLVHIWQLIGFRNRLVVLINWIWYYFFYERAVRIITPDKTQTERIDG